MGIGCDFPVAVALKLDAPGVCSGWLIELGHLWIQCILRRTKRCAVERDTTDKLRVTNRDHRRGVGTVAFPEEVCFRDARSEEHTSELQSLMRISYAVFCLKKKTQNQIENQHTIR